MCVCQVRLVAFFPPKYQQEYESKKLEAQAMGIADDEITCLRFAVAKND
jgi:hypothetical protein